MTMPLFRLAVQGLLESDSPRALGSYADMQPYDCKESQELTERQRMGCDDVLDKRVDKYVEHHKRAVAMYTSAPTA